jgi:PAS domain S-box-containing protein
MGERHSQYGVHLDGHHDHALVLDFCDSGIGAFAVDVEHRVVSWNGAAEALLGYRADEVLGRRCADVLRACPADSGNASLVPCARCPLADDARGHRARSFEVHISTREGESRWFSVGVLRGQTLAGDQRIVHLFSDVSAYHTLDDSLMRMRKPADESGDQRSDVMAPSHRGGRTEPLTAREKETLRLLSHGLGTREIAEALSISRITARNHVTRVMEKLGANTRLQAVVIAAQRGLL